MLPATRNDRNGIDAGHILSLLAPSCRPVNCIRLSAPGGMDTNAEEQLPAPHIVMQVIDFIIYFKKLDRDDLTAPTPRLAPCQQSIQSLITLR